MSEETGLPLGVCVLPPPRRNMARTVSYPHYIHEILEHAGVGYEIVELETLSERLPNLRLLVTVGEMDLPEAISRPLRDWVAAGGAWLSVGGVCGLGDLIGAEREAPAYSGWGGGFSTLGEGYLRPQEASHPLFAHLEIPLHYFNGSPVQRTRGTLLAAALDAHGRPTERAAALENAVGKGRCLFLAPDIPGTVVRIQQGVAITRDGLCAPDGTAPIADDMLKSGDGHVLDWHLDRQDVPGIPGLRAFLQPIADQWRELLLRAIFHLAAQQNVTLPVLWLYPRNLPALGHISHDTDGNEPDKAWKLLETLQTAQIHSTWCTILPGYSADIMTAIREAGHELATHYDAVSDDTHWSEAEFDRQWKQLIELFGGERPVSNKNHYLRWEGDTEFFDWCAARGIQLDQSKGASKTGEGGYNFGSCHLYFPLAPDGRKIDVLELPTPTQDLCVFAPSVLVEPLLKAAERHYGILHLLFHPAHIDKPGVADSLLEAVRKGRECGMEWWTGREMNDWERARRQAQWSDFHAASEGGASVQLRAGEAALKDATVLWLSPTARTVRVNGAEVPSHRVTRWGFDFQSCTLCAEPETACAIEIAT